MHDVCAQRPREPHEQQRVEVAWRHDPHRRHLERTVEVGRVPGGIVEPDEDRVDTSLCERRQERQEVALRPADAADPVDVHDPHRERTRSARRASAAAARMASRKSQATR